ncbi:PepSY-associated TM helix domain-containing protein [Fibrivirga algicola]|uniref:PepSY domain-containing protein n=1 Tax=Fibrivirga algicola TaxID=2950420 RepID=A0ABX0QGR1_9BACT|nr:PepSY-associated TM helix domain-containing protein [Fibrivirga algicola]NID11078.1 PepSY domain-containing protein [Fibrivirga algicola]
MTFLDKITYKLHRIFGLIGGLFVLMLTLTGSILLFDNAIDGWLNPSTVSVTPGTTRQPYDTVLQTLQRHYPTGTVRTMTLYANTDNRAIRAEVRDGKKRLWAYVNPYTGQFLGDRDSEAAFVRKARQLHEHLLIPPVGDWILFIVGISLIGSVITGTWYYRKSLLSVFSVGIRWNKPKRILYGDLHKYLGVAALAFLLIISVSGTFFHWEHIERAFGEGKPRDARQEATSIEPVKAIDALIAQSQRQLAGFMPEVVVFPDETGKPVVIRGNGADANPFLGKFTSAAEFDGQTGKLTKVFRASEADAEYKAEHVLEELHFGRFGGLATRLLYVVLALAMAVVTGTGLLIWWVKR